ncbi:MAG: CBS domain-containing protein [Kofleriaceae bacterium]
MSKVLVKHIMSSPVITFFAEQTLPLAEDVMRAKHLRHLPVVDERGMLVGLVTHRDLLRAEISTLCGLTPDERRAREDEVLIAQVMTRDVWTVTEDTLASVAGRTLLDHKYGCLPVVDPTGFLVGIVTERDFMELAVKTLRAHDPENRSQWQPARPRKLHSRISSRLPLRPRDTIDQI